MPRKKRIDYPGTLHHIIVRGIDKKWIFNDDQDRVEFLDRFKNAIKKNNSQCMAWVLIPNHFHLLIKTGEKSLSSLMRSLLTSYAIYFNKKNKRNGYVYQGRYKDILCEEEAYLLELIRYIHLNPIRAGMLKSIDELIKYKWSGHGVILGNRKNEWQEVTEVLLRFGKNKGLAKKRYNEFVEEGLSMGKRNDLTGGGVIRSYGGWEKVKEMKKNRINWRADDRILGETDFVEKIFKKLDEDYKAKFERKKKSLTIEKITDYVVKEIKISKDEIFTRSKKEKITDAKALISYMSSKELELTTIEIGKYLKITRQGVSKAKERGRVLIEKYNIII